MTGSNFNLTWIRDGLTCPGKSQRGLALALGLDPSGVSRLLNGKRALKAAEIEIVSRYLGVAPSASTGAAAISPVTGAPALAARPTSVPESPVPEIPAPASLSRDLPVRGTAVGGEDAGFDFNGEVVDYVRRPPGLAGTQRAFAVFASGDSMSPRYEEGELVFVHPGRPATPGCDVIVELKGRDGEPGHCFLKRLIRRAEEELILRQFNPPKEVRISQRQVRAVYRVMTASELLGV